MGPLHRSAVTLGFYGDDLDPAEFTACLGVAPTVGVTKGGSWVTSAGIEKIAGTGSWRLLAERCQPADLDGQITRLLAPLLVDLPIWRRLSAQFRGRLFCGLFLCEPNEGLTLRPLTLSMIGERGLALDLDVYERELPD
jgi:hypothetical protein